MNELLKQYKSIKEKYPDAILLFRVGDFYETFGEDAALISQLLDITLSHTNNIELKTSAGFPFHFLNTYLRLLVKAGHKVAICEQLEDPKNNCTSKRGVTDYHKL